MLFVWGGAALAAAGGTGRFSFTAQAGIFRPSSADVRTLYGNTAWPLSVQAGFRVWGPLTVFLGYRIIKLSGTTVIVGPAFEDESYALRLTHTAWRGGLQLEAFAGPWNFRCFGGVDFVAFKETWTGVAISSSGKSTGYLAGGGVGFRILRGLDLTAMVEFSRAVTSGDGPLTARPQLGGVEAGLGLVVRF
jgi:hypothetical protein